MPPPRCRLCSRRSAGGRIQGRFPRNRACWVLDTGSVKLQKIVINILGGAAPIGIAIPSGALYQVTLS